jgi:hypothetical protein
MADNTQLSVRVGDGDIAVTREISHGGDTAKLQGVFAMGISGNEGAYTAAAINGDATNGLDVDVTRVGGTVTVDGSGVTQPVSHAGLTELAAAINASSQVDVNIAASAATVAVSNAGLTELAAAINASSQMDVNVAAGTVAVTHAALTELAAAINSNLVDVNIVSGGGSGGTSVADDADFTDGTTALTPIGGVYESSPSTVTDGDIGMAGITETRALKVHVASGGVSGIVDDAGFTAGTSEGVLMMGVASADTVDANDAGAIAMTTARAMHVAVQNTVTVASHAVTNAGTFAVQAASAGIAADDAGVSGNPVLLAGSSIQTDGTDPGAVSAESDVATLRTDMQRNLLVNLTHPRFWHVSADYSGAQTNTSVKAAPGASLSLYITDLVISNGATAGNVTLLDGSGGTVLFEIYPAINGGVSKEFRNPIKLTANTALCITSTTVTTHSIFVSGYIAP